MSSSKGRKYLLKFSGLVRTKILGDHKAYVGNQERECQRMTKANMKRNGLVTA